jgi:hypothetical protein
MRTSLKSGRRDATALAGSGQTDKRSAFASARTDRQEVICYLMDRQTGGLFC